MRTARGSRRPASPPTPAISHREALRLAEPTDVERVARLCGRRRVGAGRRRAARAALPGARRRACACWMPARHRAARPAIWPSSSPASRNSSRSTSTRSGRRASNRTSRGSASRPGSSSRDAAEPTTWWDGRPFERILLDVPCSGSGRDPPPSGHQAAAPVGRRRALCGAAVGAAGRLLGAARAGRAPRLCELFGVRRGKRGRRRPVPRREAAGGGGDRIC